VAAALAAHGLVDQDFGERMRWYALHARGCGRGRPGGERRSRTSGRAGAVVLERLRELSAEEPAPAGSGRGVVDGGDDAGHARA
jgi:hypothetical protein